MSKLKGWHITNSALPPSLVKNGALLLTRYDDDGHRKGLSILFSDREEFLQALDAMEKYAGRSSEQMRKALVDIASSTKPLAPWWVYSACLRGLGMDPGKRIGGFARVLTREFNQVEQQQQAPQCPELKTSDQG